MAQQTRPRPDNQPINKEPKRPRIQPAPFFAYPTGKAVPLENNSSLFKGKTFHVRCDFPVLYQVQFIRDIEALGGSTNVPDAWEADYIINNPPEIDAQWQKELRRRVKAEKMPRPPIQRPYHWIYACHHAGEIVPEEELHSQPVFTKWDHTLRRPVPLLVYITVNLPRHGDEDVNGALCAAEATLESNGGFRSATRSHADVLLLNLNTVAGRKFQAEAKPDQVIWSREEFEQFAAASVSLDLGRDQHPHEVVVARTNTRSVSAAPPPRRTTRKEFTAEDDDLIIRSIAVLDPNKKRMASKSFYNELMNSKDPNVVHWINRHTAESWRERVRKRQAPFRLRVDAYRHDGIDSTFCTREERENGTIPAGLRKEPTVDKSTAARVPAPVEQDGGSSVDGTIGDVREATVEKSVSSDKSTTKKRKQSSETVSGSEKSATANKKQKTSRRGMMPIDSQLRASPPPAAEAGPSRQRTEIRTATRVKPRKAAEEDVFDDNWDSPNSDASARGKAKHVAKRKPILDQPEVPTKQYLAPASSPAEPLVRTKSFVALEQAMEDAIQEDSAAEGDPDTDDAELENDLHRTIARVQQSTNGTKRNGTSAETHTAPCKNDTQATEMTMSQPSISQVPDTQAHITEGEMTELMHIQNPIQREHANDFPVTMTGRIHLDSVQIQGLPVAIDGAVGQIQPLTVNQLQAVDSVPTPRINARNGHEARQTAGAPTPSASGPPGQPRNASRAQTDQEKRDELTRIVVGLVQEYDLNYTAVHRLILECRKRYQHVSQPLLRGLIEQALAADAQE